MALKLTTAATVPAVTLAEAKAHCRVEVSDDDTLLTAMIVAATDAAEQMTGRALMAQTWKLTLDAFPCALALTRLPVQSVTDLSYVDSAGVVQSLDPSLYALDNLDDFGPAYVIPAYGLTWPQSRSQANAVQLSFIAGYSSAAAVPEPFKSWIKLQVGAMYEHREAFADKQTYPLGFADRLLDRYRVFYP